MQDKEQTTEKVNWMFTLFSIIVIGCLATLVAAYTLKIVPERMKIWSDMGVELPVLTVIVVNNDQPLIYIAGLIGIINAIFALVSRPSTKFIVFVIAVVVLLIIGTGVYFGMELPMKNLQEQLQTEPR